MGIKKILKGQISKYPKICYVHIPKCGGVSLIDSLYKATYPMWVNAAPVRRTIDLNASKMVANIFGLDMMYVRMILLSEHLARPTNIFVHGHTAVSSKILNEFCHDWKFITVLRDPVDRYISEFVYNTYKSSDWLKNDLNIEQYVDSEKSLNSATTITRFLTGMSYEQILEKGHQRSVDEAITNLDMFFSVGFLDSLSNWKSSLNDRLNIKLSIDVKNSSPNKSATKQITEKKEILDKVNMLCEIDADIYKQAKAKFSI